MSLKAVGGRVQAEYVEDMARQVHVCSDVAVDCDRHCRYRMGMFHVLLLAGIAPQLVGQILEVVACALLMMTKAGR